MSKPKILIFAPREEPHEHHRARSKVPASSSRSATRPGSCRAPSTRTTVVAAAREAVALMGTSIRHTPISRRVMEASQRLRDRREIHRRRRRHRHRGGDRARHHGLPCADRGQLLRRRRADHGVHAGDPQEGARARRRRARRANGASRITPPPSSAAAHPTTIPASPRPRRARPHRHAGRAPAGAVASAASSPTIPTFAPAKFLLPASSRSTTTRCCGNPTWCRSTSC